MSNPLDDETRLSERLDDRTRFSSRTPLPNDGDNADDKTRFSKPRENLDAATQALSWEEGSGAPRPLSPEPLSGQPITLMTEESTELSYDGESDRVSIQVYEPRSFVDDPSAYSTAQPLRDGEYETAPTLRGGDIRRRAVANRARRYRQTTKLLMFGFVGVMGAGVVVAAITLASLLNG